jgi:hypothetical protein
VHKGKTEKAQRFFLSEKFTLFRVLRMRYPIVVSFVLLAILVSLLTQPLGSSAAGAPNETSAPPSPTTAQVTPPPKGTVANQASGENPDVNDGSLGTAGQWTRFPSWLLPDTKGISISALGVVFLLIGITLLLLYMRRRRRPPRAPWPTSTVPFLKSSDGSLYFRLDRLDKEGLIIGRGNQGVDLRIEESIPYADTVSNRHARIYYDATYGNVIIEDLGSTNGILINGRQAPRKNLLKDGWVVNLGSVTLTYRDGESDTGPLDG